MVFCLEMLSLDHAAALWESLKINKIRRRAKTSNIRCHVSLLPTCLQLLTIFLLRHMNESTWPKCLLLDDIRDAVRQLVCSRVYGPRDSNNHARCTRIRTRTCPVSQEPTCPSRRYITYSCSRQSYLQRNDYRTNVEMRQVQCEETNILPLPRTPMTDPSRTRWSLVIGRQYTCFLIVRA